MFQCNSLDIQAPAVDLNNDEHARTQVQPFVLAPRLVEMISPINYAPRMEQPCTRMDQFQYL